MIAKKILAFLPLLMCAVALFAQKVDFTVQAPGAVEVGEQFRMTFNVNAKGSNFQPPDLNAFTVYTGPNVSTSSSVQIINGQVSQSVSYSYTYILAGTKEGKFQIGPATITVNGKNYTSRPFNIEVVKSGNANNQRQTQQSVQDETIPQGEVADQDLFVRVNLNRKNVFQGEHIIATIKIYTRVDLADLGNIKMPSFDGFWSQDFDNQGQISLVRENVNGQIYSVGVLKKAILFPQRSGEISIDPVEVECVIRQRVKRSRSVFDDFFGNSYQAVQKNIKSQPVNVVVKPLPSNKPMGFTGAVGRFKMQATLDKTQVNTNDAITLRVKITGNGNLKLVDPMKFKFPADFEIYDPKVTLDVNNTENGSLGTKTFEYLVIPRHAGNFTINAVPFTFFDPESGQYQTTTTPEFRISVSKSADDQGTAVVSSYSKEDIKFIGSDIRFIKTGAVVLNPANHYLFTKSYFWFLYLASLVLFSLVLVIRKEQIRKNSDLARVKNRKASKLSQKRLKLAKEYKDKNLREAFYEEIQKALWGYLSDKLSIPLAGLNKEKVTEVIGEKGVDPNVTHDLIGLIERAEFARFAPSQTTHDMDEVYNDSFEMIIKLDSIIRN